MAGNLDSRVLKYIKLSNEIGFALIKYVCGHNEPAVAVKFNAVPIFIIDYGPTNLLALSRNPSKTSIVCSALASKSNVWISTCDTSKVENVGNIASFFIATASEKERAIKLLVELSQIIVNQDDSNTFVSKAAAILHKDGSKFSKHVHTEGSTIVQKKAEEPTQSTRNEFDSMLLENATNSQRESQIQQDKTKTIAAGVGAAAAGAAVLGLAAYGLFKLVKSPDSSGSSSNRPRSRRQKR